MTRTGFFPAIVLAALVTGAAPAACETITVTITALEFSPAEIEAKVGDTIEWVNKDAFDHTATVDGGWDVAIPAGTTAAMVVEKAETAEYFCRFHPNMTGRLVSRP